MGSERGSASLLALIMMMLLGSMGATLLMLSKTDIQIAANHRDGIAAQYLAEAGIHHAVAKLTTDHEFVSQTRIKNQKTTSESLGILPIAGSYTVQTGPDSTTTNPNIRLIKATGIVNKAQRQVTAKITLPIANELDSIVIMWNY